MDRNCVIVSEKRPVSVWTPENGPICDWQLVSNFTSQLGSRRVEQAADGEDQTSSDETSVLEWFLARPELSLFDLNIAAVFIRPAESRGPAPAFQPLRCYHLFGGIPIACIPKLIYRSYVVTLC